ncbi:hypothetical protein [Nibricoccus sp. IMCC34717]|uniref:hypothetical protein n=1 Tax=Nibricoccus sp. IMCC34717 TaxID=3034021 RepID=UPI00384C19EC
MRIIKFGCALLAAWCGSCGYAEDFGGGQVLAAPGGRFVFGQISGFARHQYMLDTQTGRLWRIVVTNANVTALEPVPYALVSGGLALEPAAEKLADGLPPGWRYAEASDKTNAQANVPRDAEGYTAEVWDKVAAKAEAEGDSMMAKAARERAEKLRK